MKKIILGLLTVLMFIPVIVFAVEEPKLVKVYIFEAGGCPWCEREMEYLKSLDGYNKKFVIETRELYVDHETWAEGKDYELGKAVAEAFTLAGFDDASYYGTPFVVISDTYAATAYSTSLETYINEAYENGDNDIVGCYEDGSTECYIRPAMQNAAKEEDDKNENNNVVAIVVISVVLALLLGGIIGLIIFVSLRNKENN